MDAPTRRAVLAAGAALAPTAGCIGFTTESQTETGRSGPPEAFDLREANVTEVRIEDRGDGQFRFDVTLYHDDDGEDGYADWWQVETPEGDRLGRRDLLHAHSTAPFTRSETVAVPSEVDCVVVRGHDQTHGYGGQAMAVSVPDGETNAARQGPERGPVDCP